MMYEGVLFMGHAYLGKCSMGKKPTGCMYGHTENWALRQSLGVP
jgi:hypothetical protein